MRVLRYGVIGVFLLSPQKNLWKFVLSRTILVQPKPDKQGFSVDTKISNHFSK